jgi:alpha-galactosidase
MSTKAGGGTPVWTEPGRAAVIRYRIGGEARVMELEEPNHTRHLEGLRFIWRWQSEDGDFDVETPGFRMWVRVTHRGDTPVYLDEIDVLTARMPDLGQGTRKWSVYQNGWQSWSPAFARHLGNGLHATPGTASYQRLHQPHWEPGGDAVISSEWVTVVSTWGTQGRASLLAGFVTTGDQLAEIRVKEDGSRLTARCYFDGIRLDPGESASSELLVVQARPDPLALLEWWADEAAREMKTRVPEDPPTGWCSWYFFYGENSSQDVLDNVRAMEEHKLPLDVVLIDDGYQSAIGDWFSLDEGKFPKGIEPVAGEIRQAGRRVGLWTAPFGVAADSQLFADHPDWILRDESDEPVVGWEHWGTTCYALDCTHPQVLDWLGRIFGRMKEEWGVSFFKIDFLFAAARPGERHDPSATRAQALRRGVEAIRKAVGRKAFLLGCGAPLGPCLGVVDGMRIGPDVDPNWHPVWRHDLSSVSTQNALRNVITRAPFHGRLWANDPDCVLVRPRSDDMDLKLNEMRTVVALVALSGGLTLDSDNLHAIDPGRLKYLRQILPPTGVSARPLDLFDNEMPRLFVLPVERDWGQWWVAGVVNWDDRTTETSMRLDKMGLPSGRYHVFHYWRRRYLGIVDDVVTIQRHEPHETAVLLFKPVTARPDLLTTTFHVCQGLVEIASYEFEIIDSQAKVKVALEKEGRQFGRVFFVVPGDWRVTEAEVAGRRQAPVAEAPHLVSFGLTLEDRAEVEVRFENNAL